MTVYGTVRFVAFGEPASAELTSEGWKVRGRPDLDLDGTLDALADPREFGPAHGDPMAAAVMKLAEALGGTYELAGLPGPPAGTIY